MTYIYDVEQLFDNSIPAFLSYNCCIIVDKNVDASARLLPPATKLRQGNVFTPVCHSLHRGVSVQGLSVQGSLCPWRGGGLCPLGGFLSGGLCPGGLCQCGWYASYWNVFLLNDETENHVCDASFRCNF